MHGRHRRQRSRLPLRAVAIAAACVALGGAGAIWVRADQPRIQVADAAGLPPVAAPLPPAAVPLEFTHPHFTPPPRPPPSTRAAVVHHPVTVATPTPAPTPTPTVVATTPPPSTRYTCPIGAGLAKGRIDEGVDYSGAGAVYALGPGVVTYASSSSGWPGGAYVAYRLTSGWEAGKYVYVAEEATITVWVGQHVSAGTEVAHAYGGGSGIETGWSQPPGTSDQALAYYHYSDGVPTPEGYDFSSLLSQLC